MKLVIISDLHIFGNEDPIYRSLLRLIRERAEAGDVMVLAGDIFDLFVGGKAVFLERYSEFFAALDAAAARGVRLEYIEGNHDFGLQPAFARYAGVTVRGHDVNLELAGRRFFIAHGDTANRKDYGYRALRAFFRSPVMKLLVRACPGVWLDRIGNASSHTSRQYRPSVVSEKLRKVYRNFACDRLMEGYDYVVLGHCHDLDEMSFQIGGRAGQYINVGFPRVHGSYLSWSPGEELIRREALPSAE